MAQTARLDFKRLLVLGVCLALGVLFWSSPALVPVKLLVVMMHESGHALAALLVGGHVQRVVISSDQSGYCLSAVPPGFLDAVVVYSSGYLGSAVAGAALLFLGFRFRLHRFVVYAFSAWLVVMAIFFSGSTFTFAFCVVWAAFLVIAARKLKDSAVEWLVLFLAAFTGLYAVFDLRDDLWNSAVRAHSDAALLASLTGIPSILWAVLWSLFGLVLIGLAAFSAIRAGPRPAPRLKTAL